MMKLLTREICKAMPRLYATDGDKDAKVIVKFFGGSYTGYFKEADAVLKDGTRVSLEHVHCDTRNRLSYRPPGEQWQGVEDVLLFGLATFGHYPELGNASFNELKGARVPPFGLPLERDRHFHDKTLGECKEYEETGRWPVKESE